MATREQLVAQWSVELAPLAGAGAPALPAALPAQVPGCIHTDAIAAGLIADISVNGREADQQWLWRTDSAYRTTIPQRSHAGFTELVFRGIDTVADIWINGTLRASVKNMHRTHTVDITEEINAGDVQVEVRIAAPLPDAEKHVAELGLYPRPYDMPYNYQRKMACSYGWDWGPITISSGLWRPVELHNWSVAKLEAVGVTGTLAGQMPTLSGSFEVRGETAGLQVRVSVLDGGSVLASSTVPAESGSIPAFEVAKAQLWWPRGRGEQRRYDVLIELLADGDVVDSLTRQVGFRSVEVDTSEAEGGHLFAIKVNGERLWIRGANWIPDDPFPTRVDAARYRQRLDDMLEAGITGIRVWGGGIYESEDFYNLCDTEGIVVWQDFLFACAAYPETPEMFEEVRLEATEAVRRLQSHPSLVIWCGGNECMEGFQYWGWQDDLAGKPWGETFYKQTIPAVVSALDPARPYIPGSPFSTHSEDTKSFESGTNHIWDVWNELGYDRYEEYTPSFAAEFGFNGPGSWPSLTRAIGKDTLDSRDPDLAIHQKAHDGMRKVAEGLAREWQEPPVAGVEWYFAASLSQARAVQTGLKHFRSLYERCSGTILWQFNDMWPAISWAVLDVTGHRKLAWYAMQEAYRPRAVFLARPDHEMALTVINDTAEDWDTPVDLSLVNSDGEVVESTRVQLLVPRYSAKRFNTYKLLPKLHEAGNLTFVCADAGGIRTARRASRQPAAGTMPWRANSSIEVSGNTARLTVTADHFVHELCILPELIVEGARADRQFVALLPGETAVFDITAPTSLEALKGRADEIVWSHNRLLAQ